MIRFPVRVIVADDDPTVCAALVEVLRTGGFEVVGIASDATEAIAMARDAEPDVALVDVRMSGGGMHATREISRSVEGCRVVALSAHADEGTVLQMFIAGAVGFFIKGGPTDELLETIGRAARAQGSFPVEVMAGVIDGLSRRLEDGSRVEATLRRSEAKFRGLLESAPDAIVIVNRRGEIIIVNERAESMFGYARGILLGKPVESLLPERAYAAHLEHRLRYLCDPQPRPMGVGSRFIGRRANGTEFPVDVSLSTLETSEGSLIIAFVRDVSERERAREELAGLERAVQAQEEQREIMIHLVRAQEEERARIAADVHDDSIQVMTAAVMRLHVLRTTLVDPDQLEALDRLNETIQHAIDRLRFLVFELRPTGLESDGLAATLRRYLKETEPEIAADAVSFTDRLAEEPSPEVRSIVYRIALEALANVRKHARARCVEVLLESKDKGVRLQIKDDGRGFEPAQPREGGHIGLASMDERSRAAGGSYRIESAPGSGSIIEVWIPDRRERGTEGEPIVIRDIEDVAEDRSGP